MIVNLGISINGGEPVRGEISVQQDVERVQSLSATKPDTAWTYVDKAGHFHAYDDDGNLPTLRAEFKHKDCDGSCGGVCGGEGYDVRVYRCIACGKKVKPAVVPDTAPMLIPGPRSWTVVVYDAVPDGLFSFVANAEDRQLFGFAEQVGRSVESSFDGRVVVTSTCAAHPVAFRKTRRAVAEAKAGAK